MMEPRIKWGIAAISLLLLFLIASKLSSFKEQNRELESDLIVLLKEAETYAGLKKQWDQSKEGEKLLEKLKNIQSPTESFTRNKKITVRYSDLTKKMLNTITHTILASDAKIIKLSVQKDNDKNTIELEVQS